MSRPRFLGDHDLNENIVAGVLRREPAAEFLRLRETGLEAEPDAAVLAFAARENLIVVSHDVNTLPAAAYKRIAAGEPMAGLLMVHQLHALAPIIDSLVLIWSASEAEEWSGQAVFLPL